jgi:hypothetical protein
MRTKALISVLATLVIAANAYGQETGAGARRIEVGAFPGG